jgi:hypothetical protein
MEGAQDFGGKHLNLLKQHPSETIGYFEPAFVFVNQFKNSAVGGKITLICHLLTNSGILVVVKVVVAVIEYSVVLQPYWLMHLKIEANRRHFLITQILLTGR